MIGQAIPGTVVVNHPHGCGHLGEETEHIIRTMAGFCGHPNVAGVLLVGLGCELITPEVIAGEITRVGQRFEIVSIQAEGGTTPAVNKGRLLAEKLLKEAATAVREPIDISEFIVGTNCGGSDTLSGLTANPALGAACDLLVAEGGTAFLSETPELIGAEQVLAALYELLRGFQAADDQRHGELLHEVLAEHPDHVYAGLLTVLMRLVFILYAEDRGLLSNDPVYVNHYSVTGLFERLRADAGLRGPT